MDCEELARVVRAVDTHHLRADVDQTLERDEPETLRRLVFLTRCGCRNQLGRSHQRLPDSHSD